MGGRDHVESVTGFDWNHWPESMEYAPSEAIRLTDEFSGKIKLLITDMVMPEMNGRDLAKHILASQSGLKCLFMSGYTADIIAHQGILDEGVCFIQKPFSRNELAIKIRSALERKGA